MTFSLIGVLEGRMCIQRSEWNDTVGVDTGCVWPKIRKQMSERRDTYKTYISQFSHLSLTHTHIHIYIYIYIYHIKEKPEKLLIYIYIYIYIYNLVGLRFMTYQQL